MTKILEVCSSTYDGASDDLLTAGAAPAISAANVRAIASAPAAGDVITMSGSTLVVPD